VAALRCALPPWRRCAPSLSWRTYLLGPAAPLAAGESRSPLPLATRAASRAAAPSAATTRSAAAWRLALRSAAVRRCALSLSQRLFWWARQRHSPSVRRARLSPPFGDARCRPSRGAVICHCALDGGVADGFRSMAAVRPVAIPAPISVGPAAPLDVGGARSPCPRRRALPAEPRCGPLPAACSAAAWRFCAAPRRRGGGAPRRHPGGWHPSGGPSPPTGLRLWRLKPNAVAPRSRAGSATHPPSPALGGSPGMRRKASKPVCSEACTVRLWRLKPNAVAPRSRACKVPLGTLAAPAAGRARNPRTLTGTGAERDGRREAPPGADDYLPGQKVAGNAA